MSDVELYPDERNKIISAWAEIQRKYMSRENTRQNLISLAEEAEGRFRELGFRVVVDISNLEVTDRNEVIYSPIISIEGRVTPEVFGHDHEKHAVQIQDGLYDGKAGTVTPDGKLKERAIQIPSS